MVLLQSCYINIFKYNSTIECTYNYTVLTKWNRIFAYRGRMVRLNGVPVPDVTRTNWEEGRLVSF